MDTGVAAKVEEVSLCHVILSSSAAIPLQLDQVVALLGAGLKEGRVPPLCGLEGVVGQLGALVATQRCTLQFLKTLSGIAAAAKKGPFKVWERNGGSRLRIHIITCR